MPYMSEGRGQGQLLLLPGLLQKELGLFRILCLPPKHELTDRVHVARATIRPPIKRHEARNNICIIVILGLSF